MLTSDLKVVFQLLEAQATSIDGRADSCVAYSGLTSVCNGTLAVDSGLVSASDEFKASASATVDLLDGLAPAIGRIGKLFDETIPYIIDWGIGLMTAFMGLTVFFGLWSVTCGSATRQKLVIAFSAVALTLMCPLIAFELTLSVVVSDFCMGLEDGDASLMVMANSYAPKSTRGLVAYYASCNGTNPLAADLASSGESVVLINATAAGLLPGRECSDATLGLVQDESLAAQEEIRAMEGDVGCASVNPYFSQIIYRVICGDVVEGVYWIWVVQLACAVSLWVLLFFVQAEVLARENETKINLALQEQRLGLKPSTFIPKKGTSKRRVYDRKQRKHLLAEDKKVAEQLAVSAAAQLLALRLPCACACLRLRGAQEALLLAPLLPAANGLLALHRVCIGCC